MSINNSNVKMLDSIIKIDDNMYLPISDMSIVYNIKINYIESTKRVVIDKLDTGMRKAMSTAVTNIKFKPRALSKNIGTLKQGEIVSLFYTTSKGWAQIRKDDGTVGYVKANKLGNEYIIRQDMQKRGEAISISKNEYATGNFELNDRTGTKRIVLSNLFNTKEEKNTSNEELNTKKWVSITNKLLESQSNDVLNDYKLRTSFIDLIVDKAMKNSINGICIDFNGIENKELLKRFIIECTPKLREIGVSTCIVLNDGLERNDYINIVDYIVE